ncbi:MAG: prophage regulatory protein [Glaciecola sp.]|jgi:prophage regulatory protein
MTIKTKSTNCNLSTTNISSDDRIIRFKELKDKIGLSRSHIHNLISKGKFPKQIKLGDRASGWLESQVTEWLNHRIAESKSLSDR